MILAHTVVTAS